MKKRFCENEKSMMKASMLRTVKQNDAETLTPHGLVASWAAGHTSPGVPTPHCCQRQRTPTCSISTEAIIWAEHISNL